ncbi:putative monocarboxylate transporter mch1 [Coniosporium tulheliwenetii]|uniref:Monocarboxylate transporter mch1 n=1 Tax=Coniosporium tulheliwenetii TaxID=3383036 RepID=A0ACC2ZK13_9PEZI|nr:putative monocarboxylate transporter mch1 [Cladosporium sp. JES 115]
MPPTNGGIDKLDYHPGGRPLLQVDDSASETGRPSHDTSYAGSFFENVAEGIVERDRRKMRRQIIRYTSFAWAIVNCLCGGSITAYSLYGHIFQSRLRYTQFQVNIASITAELALYLPVPVFGYLCDRWGPGIPCFISGCLFGFGYLLAAFTYRSGPEPSAGGDGWPFGVMVLAFVGIGMGTSSMYLSAVTTCAKNFGRGKHKGVALALPIASFGLSGMWQSQVGSRLLYERRPDGSKGDVDIVDEEEMIDEAVEELEQSGLLQESEFFHRAANMHGYGTMPRQDLSDSTFDFLNAEAEDLKARAQEEQRKKNWLLNEETRRFLSDKTMWWLAAGFFLVTGPGEAFINNLGTIIGTLYPPTSSTSEIPTSAATHVSIVAITSTLARLLTGTISDLVAPSAAAHQHRRGPNSLANSIDSLTPQTTQATGFSISRLTFLLAFSLLLSIGQIVLASGLVQNHGDRFWLVSACVGAGYGAAFSLVPIILSVVWGVENFGTNWGIVAMVPAAGAALWGIVYSAVYERGAGEGGPEGADVLCYGVQCYQSTFWAMAISVWVACGLWLWAWKGPGGWARRGIAV